MIAFVKKLLGRDREERVAHELYTRTVKLARRPAFYLDLAVEDTLDGRFDLIILHLWLVVARFHVLRAGKKDQAWTAARLEERLLAIHFADMDQALREIGVGDLSVGKKVKAMAEAFYGRARAYDAAMAALDQDGDESLLREALARNVYRGRDIDPKTVEGLARYVLAARRMLAEEPAESLFAGRFEAPEPASAPAQEEDRT